MRSGTGFQAIYTTFKKASHRRFIDHKIINENHRRIGAGLPACCSWAAAGEQQEE
jgi:hypothetical protein